MTWVLKSLKHLLLKLLTKVHNVWAKKVLRSYISWYWGVVQNWKKNWLVVCKMTYEDFGKLSPEHLIVSKLGFWWNPFIQIRKYMSLKFTEELCVMTMKNDAKFERKLTCAFKLTWGIWWILTRALKHLKKFHFNGIFSTKVYNFWAKQVQRGYFWWHWRLIQNLKENWLVLSK